MSKKQRLADTLPLLAESLMRRDLARIEAMRPCLPWLAFWLRRIVLVVWWSYTLQLRMQFRFWLRARRLRRLCPASSPPPSVIAVDIEAINISTTTHPLISIIIPTYGQVDFTVRCLASIAKHPPAAAFEIIVVDDAFPGSEVACLRRVRGIRLLRNPANLGFLRACNAAAAMVRGEFLLFLNNDTQVGPAWADSMLALFRSHADVGAVGSKLLYPNGRLQEAGGIIWSDGSGWNFGRHEDADHPRYNYVREVDYCSAASLMLPRVLFERLGGFDERYAPAYFEDSDLCFRLRSMGLKTLYQPASVVVHDEGTSHGNDLATGIKSCQVTNQRVFTRIWGDVLARDHFPNGQHVLRAREHARNRPIVLIIDHQIPEPDRDAGSRTMLCLMRALLAEDMVVKFWPHNLFYKPGYVEALQGLGVEVFHGPHQEPFATWIRQNGVELDLVLLSRPDVVEDFLAPVRAHSTARVLYYGQDLHFSRLRMQGTVWSDEQLLRAADRMEEHERTVWQGVDAVLYPSEEEAAAVRAMVPSVTAHALVPYAFERFAEPRATPPGPEIIFVAGFGHPPNADAACWFVEQVMPLVRACVPQARLSIVGSNPTPRVRSLADDAVRVIADVSDDELAAIYRRARVAVVPLRCGAGVKLKVVEALREGVPLVTTSVGTQGLPDAADIALVRNGPLGFADAVCALLQDDALWQQRCKAQIAYARQHFSVAALRQSLMQAIGPLEPVHSGVRDNAGSHSRAARRSVHAL